MIVINAMPIGRVRHPFARASALFESNWATATGTTTNAVSDGGKWTTTENDDTNLSVVTPTGLDFPSGMDTVLRVVSSYPTVAADFVGVGVNTSGVPTSPYPWTLPDVGGALYYRIYTRVVWDSDVRVQDNTCHFIEAVNTASTLGLNFYKDGFGFHYSLRGAAFSDSSHLWRLGHRGPGQYQNGDAITDGTYRHEWKVKRNGVDDYDIEWRVYDSSNALLYSPDGVGASLGAVVMNGTPGTAQATSGLGVGISDAQMRGFMVGTNGGTFTAWSASQNSYMGGFMVRNDDWCGPY